MLCDICGKNEATVHLTEIINDKVTKLHICESCAKEKGAEMEEHFGLSDLLAGLTDLGTGVEPELVTTAKCPSCGFTYDDFKKMGRLGCSECYEAFRKYLEPLLKRIHGANRHVGKVPISAGKTIKDTQTLQTLKMQLEKAIQSEEFEEAARLRDKIRELEGKGKSGKAKG
ncbi:MAG: UvrB/UvrC motif-containing protein [Candidatus Omnitrophica bacterium]|nr:UvrB/UvrC motif-containing protein [Candidatus Omnitrophota bacterium]MCM8790990.1 UvrB/UvrC motif-containing protein [Candidatus Omnitrophota bacterium]